MNLARLPGWPRLLRATLAARYVDMTGAQFDKAVAAGELPDPLQTPAGERWDRGELDTAIDRMAGNAPANDWRARVGTPR